jgi:hypothetical protein
MATKKKEITLGCKAKDLASGFTGIVVSRHYRFGGAVQYGVQAMVSAKTPSDLPAPQSFDIARLVYVGPGISHAAHPVTEIPTIKIGDEVENIANGVKGIATDMHEFLNGCIYFSIEIAAKPNEKAPDPEFAPHVQFKKIGAGIGKQIETVLARKKPPGGPTQIAESQ